MEWYAFVSVHLYVCIYEYSLGRASHKFNKLAFGVFIDSRIDNKWDSRTLRMADYTHFMMAVVWLAKTEMKFNKIEWLHDCIEFPSVACWLYITWLLLDFFFVIIIVGDQFLWWQMTSTLGLHEQYQFFSSGDDHGPSA